MAMTRTRDDDEIRRVLEALNDPLLLCNRLGLDAKRVAGGVNGSARGTRSRTRAATCASARATERSA